MTVKSITKCTKLHFSKAGSSARLSQKNAILPFRSKPSLFNLFTFINLFIIGSVNCAEEIRSEQINKRKTTLFFGVVRVKITFNYPSELIKLKYFLTKRCFFYCSLIVGWGMFQGDYSYRSETCTRVRYAPDQIIQALIRRGSGKRRIQLINDSAKTRTMATVASRIFTWRSMTELIGPVIEISQVQSL